MAPRKFIFHKERRHSNPMHILLLLFLIVGGMLVNQAFARRDLKPLFEPTPTASRMPDSYVLEARTHFDAGNLDAAISAFKEAIATDPNNGSLYAEMARVLTYSSQMATTEQERQTRLEQARTAADQAVKLAPKDSTAQAIRAFALDWYATFVRDTLMDDKQGQELLLEADQGISQATFLDPNNVNAQIYFAEIMVDTGRFKQADQALSVLLTRVPDSWEAHRVNGLYLENQGQYVPAMDEFKKASSLAPKMTFLYIKLGQSERQYGMRMPAESEKQKQYFNDALGYFDTAARLNEELGIKDPYPYLGIGYTYAQMGEFLVATNNMMKALAFNPNSPKVYGDVGMVARQGRNYELATMALQCAVQGCSSDISCEVRQCNVETDAPITITGMPLNSVTVSYYFTYSALLSGLYVPNDSTRTDYCDTALKVIGQVRAVPRFNNEPVYDSIMKESENICASYGITAPRK